MCQGCWNEAGRPTVLPASAGEFVALFRQLYEIDGVGGPLHSVLDDWNLEGNIKPYPGLDYDAETYVLCQRISDLLNSMTEPERYASVAAADGFFALPAGSE
jgi:hypothetical protein